jgi:hypothetical protein
MNDRGSENRVTAIVGIVLAILGIIAAVVVVIASLATDAHALEPTQTVTLDGEPDAGAGLRFDQIVPIAVLGGLAAVVLGELVKWLRGKR